MPKIIYNTDNELSFRNQGITGENIAPQMKDFKYNFSSGGQPDITVGFFDFNISFSMDISEDDYLDYLAWASWAGRGENFAIQFDTTKILSTTLDDVAGKGQSNKKLVPLTATGSGLAEGDRLFLISDDKLKFEGATVASISAGVSILTVDDLKFDYVSGDVCRHYRYIPACLLLKMVMLDPSRSGALDALAQGYRRFELTCKEDLT